MVFIDFFNEIMDYNPCIHYIIIQVSYIISCHPTYIGDYIISLLGEKDYPYNSY